MIMFQFQDGSIKAGLSVSDRLKSNEFQFQDGSIKAFHDLKTFLSIDRVSIPRWFDKSTPLGRAILVALQVSIPRWFDKSRTGFFRSFQSRRSDAFQFQDGSIKATQNSTLRVNKCKQLEGCFVPYFSISVVECQ